jgi:hypothetical protein
MNKTLERMRNNTVSTRKTIRGLKTVKLTLEKVKRSQKKTVQEVKTAIAPLKKI